jgi:hypothetical protein
MARQRTIGLDSTVGEMKDDAVVGSDQCRLFD